MDGADAAAATPNAHAQPSQLAPTLRSSGIHSPPDHDNGNPSSSSPMDESPTAPSVNTIGVPPERAAAPVKKRPLILDNESDAQRWLDRHQPPPGWLDQDPVALLSDKNTAVLRVVGSQSATRFIAQRLGGSDEITNRAWRIIANDDEMTPFIIEDLLQSAPERDRAALREELQTALIRQLPSGDPFIRGLAQAMYRHVEQKSKCQAWDVFAARDGKWSPGNIVHNALLLILDTLIDNKLVDTWEEHTTCIMCADDFHTRTQEEEAKKQVELAPQLLAKATERLGEAQRARQDARDQEAARVAAAACRVAEEGMAEAEAAMAAIRDDETGEFKTRMPVTWCSYHPCMHWCCSVCVNTYADLYTRRKCPYGFCPTFAFTRVMERVEPID